MPARPPVDGPPYLRASRPALALLAAIGHGVPAFDFAAAARTARRPRTTLVRLLNELTSLGLVVRVRRGDYATPRKATHALLLVEPNAYWRSLLAVDDALLLRGLDERAYACLPVRRALDFELDHALPVLPLGEDVLGKTPVFPSAVRMDLPRGRRREVRARFPSDAADDTALERAFPVLDEKTALAVLAATAEPRIVRAVRDAAPRLGHAPDAVLAAGRRFVLEDPPLPALRKNALVLPDRLREFAASAGKLHARRFLGEAAARGERP